MFPIPVSDPKSLREVFKASGVGSAIDVLRAIFNITVHPIYVSDKHRSKIDVSRALS